MAAGPRYSSSVLINNWSEDQSARQLAAIDYEAKRSRGDLTHLRKAREKAFQTQPVPHSFLGNDGEVSPGEPGFVRYGQHLQLCIAFPPAPSTSSSLGGGSYALSCNLFDTPIQGFIKTTVASQNPGASGAAASARNVFVLEPACGLNTPEGRRKEGQIMCFGDSVSLSSNPTLTLNAATRVVSLPFLLHSTRSNNITGAGRKGRQECLMTTSRSSDTEWVVCSPSGDPLSSTGEPIREGEPFCLVHRMTNAALAADPSVTAVTDFGVECEAHLQWYRSTNHSSMGHSGELPLQPALPQNIWYFRGSSDPEAGKDDRGLIPISPAAMVDKARAMILGACSIHGLRSLALALSAMDQRGTGILPTSDVRVALFEHGVRISADEFALLLGQFEESQRAVSGGGFIAIGRLLAALRADSYSSRERKAIVDAAYRHLLNFKSLGKLARNTYLGGVAAPGLKGLSETTGTIHAPPPGGVHAPPAAPTRGGGHHAPPPASPSLAGSRKPLSGADASVVTADELKFAFDAKFDPRALSKALTPVEAAFEFSRQWPEQQRPADPVSLDSFHRYYQDVSPLIGSDEEFVELVANAWHVPGAGSWKTKASKRVLVTFHKGTSTEVIVPEAEDIHDDDFEGLCGALKTLGFGGIARVKVLEVIEVE